MSLNVQDLNHASSRLNYMQWTVIRCRTVRHDENGVRHVKSLIPHRAGFHTFSSNWYLRFLICMLCTRGSRIAHSGNAGWPPSIRSSPRSRWPSTTEMLKLKRSSSFKVAEQSQAYWRHWLKNKPNFRTALVDAAALSRCTKIALIIYLVPLFILLLSTSILAQSSPASCTILQSIFAAPSRPTSTRYTCTTAIGTSIDCSGCSLVVKTFSTVIETSICDPCALSIES